MRPTIKRRWDSRAARAKQESRRKSKLAMYGVSFKTRIHGTPKQLGQKFPVVESGAKTLPPKIQMRGRVCGFSKRALEEAQKMADGGFDGYTLAVRFKDGSTQMIPVVAKSYEAFLKKIPKKLAGIDPKTIQELSVAGGAKFETVKSIFRGVGSAAKGFASGLISGKPGWSPRQTPGSPAESIGRRLGAWTKKLPGQVTKTIEAGAQKIGEIERIPERVKESYEKGRRPHEAEMRELRKQAEKAQAERRIIQFKGTACGEPTGYEDNRDRVIWLVQSKQNALEAAQLRGDKEEEREIQRDIFELKGLSRKAVGASPNAQKYIADRIAAMGGKYTKHKVSFKAKGKEVSFMAAS